MSRISEVKAKAIDLAFPEAEAWEGYVFAKGVNLTVRTVYNSIKKTIFAPLFEEESDNFQINSIKK